MNQERADRIARHLFEANAARAPFEWLTGDLKPVSLGEAYAAQTALIDLWRETDHGRIAGWKIALTSKAMQEMCGVDQPCVGGILDRNVMESPAEIACSDYVRLGLEFELAVRIREDLDGAAGEYDAERAKAHVADVMPAFELIEDRGADYSGFDAFSLVADNTWNGGVVLGRNIRGWRKVDWTSAPVTLNYNGQIERAVTGDAMGDPFAALAVVANNLLHRGMRLRAGQIVITGSTLKTRFAAPGDHARYEIDGLGAVELTVTA